MIDKWREANFAMTITTKPIKDHHWSTRPDGVAILHRDFQASIPYNRSSLPFVINNVKAERSAYRTEEAWLRNLRIFQEGLQYAKV